MIKAMGYAAAGAAAAWVVWHWNDIQQFISVVKSVGPGFGA